MLVKGYVKDAFGKPMEMVAVQQLNNLTVGKFTNSNGYFELDVPTGSMLKISILGYFTKEVLASSSINITLEQEVNDIEEVVITAPIKSKNSNLLLIGLFSAVALFIGYNQTRNTTTKNSKGDGLKKPIVKKTKPRKVTL